jgi:hypothetical protein
MFSVIDPTHTAGLHLLGNAKTERLGRVCVQLAERAPSVLPQRLHFGSLGWSHGNCKRHLFTQVIRKVRSFG